MVRSLSSPELRDISFAIHAGEILGITGLPGSGFETIPYLLAGGVAARSGSLEIDGHKIDLRKGDVGRAIRAGVAMVPERRDRDGLAFSLDASENVALPSLRRHGGGWLLKRGWQKKQYASAVRELDIRPTAPNRLIKELSGGNQQKVLLAKWLSTGPSLLVLHEPTQAVDVAAREDLLNAVRRAADRGTPVLLVTAEPSDLAHVCDRVLVYGDGVLMKELTSFDPDAIILAVYGDEEVMADEGEDE